MTSYLSAIGLVLLLMVGWITVQQLGRRFARRHPEWDALRGEGGGGCGSCLCGSGGSAGKGACRREGAERSAVGAGVSDDPNGVSGHH